MPYYKNIPYRFGNQVKKEQKLVEDRVTKEIKSVEQTKSDDIDSLKEEYEKLSGKKPHHLWKEARLKEEIEKLK